VPATNSRRSKPLISKKQPVKKSSAKPKPVDRALTIFTVGHSTRTLSQFLKLLKAYGVRRIADVRSIPRSRHTPQFNQARLAKKLRGAGIAYIHLKKLGGRRHTTKASVNLGWRNASFRGFADHMQTAEFTAGIQQLVTLARKRATAIMCAEAVPWRCHRSLIGDALLLRGIRVVDLFSATNSRPHQLTPFAKHRGLQITYPGE
jgi:uncharacterized protein (DUF488 family)